MYRFIRTATLRTAASAPGGLRFASEVTNHINRRYGLGLKFGFETYGASRIHWHFDIDSADKIQQVNAQLMEDRDYLGLLEKYKDVWAEGTMKDTLVVLVG